MKWRNARKKYISLQQHKKHIHNDTSVLQGHIWSKQTFVGDKTPLLFWSHVGQIRSKLL